MYEYLRRNLMHSLMEKYWYINDKETGAILIYIVITLNFAILPVYRNSDNRMVDKV